MEEWSGESRREEEADPAGGAEDAAPLMEPEFVSGSVPPPPEPYRPMARRRLALLTAAAVVLGVLAGAGAGYRIQPGDELAITVLEDDTLNRQLLVLPEETP